jgi:hypothetical protein
MKRFLALLLFGIIICPLKAQYTGGDNDGFSSGLLSQTNCPPFPADFIYYGGINDGYAIGLLSQTNCPPFPADFIYSGGINDGYAIGLLSQTNCPPFPADFIYSGGINDGFSSKLLNQIANCLPVLPIELLTFTASCEANTILLKWSTATELNNDYFTIERTNDGINYSIIDTVGGAGNSWQTMHYSLLDQNSQEGTNYYRLKQTDFNGQFSYSQIIAVACIWDVAVNVQVYPNPVNNQLNIEINGNSQPVNFQIINSTGAIIYNGILTQKTTLETTNFSPGIYLIRFINDNVDETKKIIKY